VTRRALVVALLVGAASAAVARGADVDRTSFRYTRELTAPAHGAVLFVPDSPLLGHARVGFGDLRLLDASGTQVPWRFFPERPIGQRSVPLLNAGLEGSTAVATLDLGPSGELHDRVTLDIPARAFVAHATVFGAETRDGPRTRLGTTTIYDVSGPQHVRSTVAQFAPTDFRWLFLRIPGVPAIKGAVVSVGGSVLPSVRRPARVTSRQLRRTTQLTLDFGYPHIPVSEIRLTSATPRYDRTVEEFVSQDGVHYTPGTVARVSSLPGAAPPGLSVEDRARFIRIVISNGDDPPLRNLHAAAYDLPRVLLAEGGHPGPYRLFYGSTTLPPPSYEFARLPRGALQLSTAGRARLGAEALNSAFRAAPDTRSFAAKHGWLVNGALALAAFVVAAGGLVALRRR
jgi:hypothetical protein